MDIDKLANLARIKIGPEDKDLFETGFKGILEYVGQIKSAPVSDASPVYNPRNILRDDSNPNTPGQYTEDLLNAAPERGEGENNKFFKVKNIL